VRARAYAGNRRASLAEADVVFNDLERSQYDVFGNENINGQLRAKEFETFANVKDPMMG
jgi:hypothetical protein